MRTSKLYFFVVAFLALSISMVSCSGDDGEAGLAGLKGDKGDQGEAGLVGPAGNDGSEMYSGESEPEATVGMVGDYYLNTATGMLYGPKVNEENWADTDGFSLMGAAGTNGTDGTKTLSGMGVPSNTIGNTGDFYLDKTSSILYGPAVTDDEGDTTWGAGLELKGAAGNANVKSYVFSIPEGVWILSEESDRLFIYGERISLYDEITEEIIESGVVLIYRITSSDNAILLPASSKTSSGNLLTESFTIGGQENILMERVLFTFADAEEELSKETLNYRAVIITGELANEVMSKADGQTGFELVAVDMGLLK